MGKNAVLQQLRRYVNRELSLNQLEGWILSHLQSAIDSGDAEYSELMDGIDVLLMKLGDGAISEVDFFGEICGIVDSAATINVTFSPQLVARFEKLDQNDSSLHITGTGLDLPVVWVR
jgi:hypothetical protein